MCAKKTAGGGRTPGMKTPVESACTAIARQPAPSRSIIRKRAHISALINGVPTNQGLLFDRVMAVVLFFFCKTSASALPPFPALFGMVTQPLLFFPILK